MAIRFRFESLGETLVERELVGIAERGEDLRPALHDVAERLRQATARRFAAEGGGDWPPLAASTVRQKARAGLDPRILHATGALRASLTRRADPGHEEIVTSRSLTFGTRLDYARLHQSGTSRMPPRRPLRFDERTKVQSLKSIQAYLIGAARA